MASNTTVTFLVVATAVTFLFFSSSCLATSDPSLYTNKSQELMEIGESRADDADAGKSLSLSDLVYGSSAAAPNREVYSI